MNTTREELLDQLVKLREIPLLVVGGGIHGAAAARVAAYNNIPTLLLERNDYASGTSSRSSKMIHGGLRYLEYFDFAQVREGVKCREDLLAAAPHLVERSSFGIPINGCLERLKFELGLTFYDRLLPPGAPKHKFVPKTTSPTPFSFTASGGFIYSDAIMEDTRMVIENILSARQYGARCMNHVDVTELSSLDSGRVGVTWKERSGLEGKFIARAVLNCAGPWFFKLVPGELRDRVRFSRGAHILFNVCWNGPALFLPLSEKGRYYFVWPHRCGTLVGTTEYEVSELSDDPLPSTPELAEIFNRLERDLPESGLNRQSAHYAFAGIRTLPLRGKHSSTSAISRRHIWASKGGIFSLIGGKFTTAQWTAEEGVKAALKSLGHNLSLNSVGREKFPGAVNLGQEEQRFRARCAISNVPQVLIDDAIKLLGGRVSSLSGESDMQAIDGLTLSGMVRIALEQEQAHTFEDIIRRRLCLEYKPNCEVLNFSQIKPVAERSGYVLARNEYQDWRERLQKIKQMLQISL